MNVSRGHRAWIVAVFIFAAAYFYFNLASHHEILGGKDEGSYITMGKNLSRLRGNVFHDPHVELGVKYGHEELFVPDGYYVEDREQALVRNGWNKGYPLVSVPFWWLDQESGWQLVNPLLSSLTLILLFLFLRDCRLQWAGLFVVVLLATNWLQIWYSRYPMSEITSQFIYVSMLFCLNLFLIFRTRKWLILLTIGAVFAVYVHFLNIFVGFGIVAGLLAKNFYGLKGAQILKQKSTYAIIVLLVLLPMATAFLNYTLDPGLSKHYSNDADYFVENSKAQAFLSVVAHGLYRQWVNITLYVHPTIIVFSILVCLTLIITDKRRWLWFTIFLVPLMVLAVFTIHTRQTNTLYCARRIVPTFLIGIYVFTAVGLDKLWVFMGKNQALIARVIGRAIVVLFGLGIVSYQVFIWAPFNGVNKGEGMPQLARDVSDAMSERGDSHANSLIFTTGMIGTLSAGFRYIYDLPVIMPATSGTQYQSVLQQAVHDGKSVYFLSSTGNPKIRLPSSMRIARIFRKDLRWTDPNSVKWDQFPTTKAFVLKYQFFKLERIAP
jgi:hypothetical protein